MNKDEKTDFEQKETWDLNFIDSDKEFKKAYIATRVLNIIINNDTRFEKLIRKSEKILEKYLS